MKKLFFPAAICVLLCFSCNNEHDLVENNPKMGTEKYPPQALAKQLAHALNGNDNLRDFLKEEALKQRDGDYEILVAEIIDREVKPESMLRFASAIEPTSTFRETLGQEEGFSTLFTEIEQNYPLLQVSIPNMEDASWETVISGQDPFLVGFLPNDYEEGNDVTAYDQKGNVVILDGKVEPEIPVIIICQNERLEAIPTSKQSEYLRKDEQPYFQSSSYVYITKHHPTIDEKIKSENDIELRFTDYNYMVVKAWFRGQNALRNYEPWTKGRPEVAVYAESAWGRKNSKVCDSKGWFDGKHKTLNWLCFYHRGEYETKPNHIFLWYELDTQDKDDYIGMGKVSKDFIGSAMVDVYYDTPGMSDFRFIFNVYK